MNLSLETRHLMLLEALDDSGSLQAAARRVHLTPSAVSLQLRELEARLGGPLFHREWRRLVPTAAGRHLTEVARRVLRELARAEDEVRGLIEGTVGTVRVTTVCLHSYRWLPRLLQDFARSWPEVDVTVVAEASAAPEAWLLDHRLDVALVAGDRPADSRLSVLPLFRDELVAVVGRGHPWFGRPAIAPEAILDEHVWADDDALAADTPLGRVLGGARPRKQSSAPMVSGVPIEMARANLGITFAPRWTIEAQLSAGEIHGVRVGAEGLWLEWAVATRAEPPEPALAAFVEALGEHHPRGAGAPIAAT